MKSKTRLPKFELIIKIDPLQSGAAKVQTFQCRAEDKDFARVKLRSMFRHFAYHHRWATSFREISVDRIK